MIIMKNNSRHCNINLVRNLQNRKSADRYNNLGLISSSKTGQERSEKIGWAREGLPVRIDREVLNSCI
jgi:hypothetical protein